MDHVLQVFHALQTLLLGLWDTKTAPKALSLHVCLGRLCQTHLYSVSHPGKSWGWSWRNEKQAEINSAELKGLVQLGTGVGNSQIQQCMNQCEMMTGNTLVPSPAAWARSLFSNKTELGAFNISILSQDSNQDVYTTASSEHDTIPRQHKGFKFSAKCTLLSQKSVCIPTRGLENTIPSIKQHFKYRLM